MKRKDELFEQNVMRLVKQTGRSDQPSDAFVEAAVNQTLDQLQNNPAGRGRQKGTTRPVWIRLLACAAAIVLLTGLAAALVLPFMNKCQIPPHAARSPQSSALPVDADCDPAATTLHSMPLSTDQHGLLADASTLQQAPVATETFYDGIAANGTAPQALLPDPLASVGITAGKVKKAGETSHQEVLFAYGKPSLNQPALREQATKIEKLASLMAKGTSEIQLLSGDKVQNRSLGTDELRVKLDRAGLGPPMAHGGTTPPNGEPVDAMFFKSYGVNPFIDTEDDHLSTFATDIDTGSYTVARRYLHEGHLPPSEAIRVEEFVNYFDYNYAAPEEDVFAVYMEAAPWTFGQGRKNSHLLRIGLQGQKISDEDRKPAVLTFVIDVSGSMGRENRLGLVKKSLRMLVENLRPEDRIGIAVYGSRGRKVMDHRSLDEKTDILAAIESLRTSGSTNAEEGIRIGYQMARDAFRKSHINRVILCSDGVANVGQTSADDLFKAIADEAKKGILLSAVGFGMGNYNDVLLERLGDKGNGHYAYVDTITEARRIFERDLTGTLQVIAREVKVQVDFNPKVVRSYRLIGYENRDVPDAKFRDDDYDGGEIGAGHTVTALYELKLWPDKRGTVATTRVRYQDAEDDHVTEFERTLTRRDLGAEFDDASDRFKLAAAVVEFAEILRKSHWAKGASLADVLGRAQQVSRRLEGDAKIIELVDLIAKAEALLPENDAAEAKPDDEEQ